MDEGLVIEIWETLRSELARKAKKENRPAEWADDTANETISRMLEADAQEPLREPLNWARLVARRIWVKDQTLENSNLSYDGVSSLDPDGTITSGSERKAQGREAPTNKDKVKIRNSIRNQMAETVTNRRDPALIAEQRDLIQKIDPDWHEHLEEGLDFSREHKLAQDVRDKIRTRMRRLEKLERRI